MAEIDKLVIDIELNTSKFKTALDNVKSSLQDIAKIDLTNLKNNLDSVAQNLNNAFKNVKSNKVNESIKNLSNEQTTISFKKNYTEIAKTFKDTTTSIDADGKKIVDSVQKTFKHKFGKDFQDETKKSENVISASVKNINNILSKGLTGLGSYFGIKFALDFVKGITSKGLETTFLSKAFSVDTGNLQQLQLLFKLIGGSAESANASIAQLYNRLNSPFDMELARGFAMLEIKERNEQGQKKDPVTLILEAIQKASTFPERDRISRLQFLGLPTEAQALANDPKQLNQLKKTIANNKYIFSKSETEQQTKIEQRFILIGERWKKIIARISDFLLPIIESFTDLIEDLLNGTMLKKLTDFKMEKVKGNWIENQKKDFKNFYHAIKKGFGIEKSPDINNNVKTKPADKNFKSLNNASQNTKVPALPTNNDEEKPPIVFIGKHARNIPSAAQLHQSTINNSISKTNNQQQVAMNIGNINLPNITNANQFTKDLHKMSRIGYGFSGNILA